MPIFNILDLIKENIACSFLSMFIYIPDDGFCIRKHDTGAFVFKIQRNDIVCFAGQLIGKLLQNNGFAAATNTGNHLNQVAVSKWRNLGQIVIPFDHLHPSGNHHTANFPGNQLKFAVYYEHFPDCVKVCSKLVVQKWYIRDSP